LEAGEFPLYVECLCNGRDDFIAHMARHGIQTRANYQPLHTVPHFHSDANLFPNSKSYGRRCVILPCGPDRTEDELQQVIRTIRKWI
jgi:dTDP-4-amino-4,6-dideoxygalactose transaminase